MLNPTQFGQQLLHTGDLDPVYIMLYHSNFPYDQKQRWCVAYWMFYHAGISSLLSERRGAGFWNACLDNYQQWPRGTERRHFRGEAARRSIAELQSRYPFVESFVDYLSRGQTFLDRQTVSISPPPFKAILSRTQEHSMFGIWIAFKIADMLDRVLGEQIDFSDCDLFWYSEPKVGAELAAREWGLGSAKSAVRRLQRELIGYPAPPSGDRLVGLQELETVLCKWKAYRNGHYYIGKDTIEIEHALACFPCDSTARLKQVLKANTAIPRRSLI